MLGVGFASAADLLGSADVKPVELFEVEKFSEGVCFDHSGRGYTSAGSAIWQFTLAGDVQKWVETGVPNGHKILADGTHLVCDGSHHAVLHLSAKGEQLAPAASECEGQPLRKPNDLSLDGDRGAFYFTDPGGSNLKNPIGTVHYVDADGKCRLFAEGLAFPNGIVRTLDGKRLLVAESQRNRILEYEIVEPGRAGVMRVFAELPSKDPAKGQTENQPDGMCFDAMGNLYVAHIGMGQVQVLDPHGKLIASYPVGMQMPSNVAFGGPQLDQLFVTGMLEAKASPGAVFRLDLGVKGLNVLPAQKP